MSWDVPDSAYPGLPAVAEPSPLLSAEELAAVQGLPPAAQTELTQLISQYQHDPQQLAAIVREVLSAQQTIQQGGTPPMGGPAAGVVQALQKHQEEIRQAEGELIQMFAAPVAAITAAAGTQPDDSKLSFSWKEMGPTTAAIAAQERGFTPSPVPNLMGGRAQGFELV